MRLVDQHRESGAPDGEPVSTAEHFQEQLSSFEEAAAKKILRSGRTLQRGIALFSVVIIAATSILVAAVLSAQRNSDLERAQFKAATLSAVFEEQIRGVVNSVLGAMEWLKSDIEANGPEKGLEHWAGRSDFAALPANIMLVGADGKVAASPTISTARGIDMSDREYFRVHVGSRQRGLFVGQPIDSRFSGGTRIPFSLRLEKADGKFDGVIEVSLNPAFLSSLYRNVDLGQTGSLTLQGADGVVRAHYTADRIEKPGGDSDIVGSPFAGAPTFPDSGFNVEGAYEAAGPDGKTRLFHWRKVQGFPLIVIAGLGRSEALTASQYQEALMLAVGGVTLILAFFMPLLLYREISKRTANEVALNSEKVKLKLANDTLADERKNLRAINEELVAAKQHAEQASNAKSEFLMNMSHEFRTPMHAILNYTNMGLKKIAVDERDKIEKYMKNTRAAGFRLLRMLNGLLDLAKLEAGKIELQTEESDLKKAIDQTLFELGSLFEEKNLCIELNIEPGSGVAVFDPHRIVQVLVNLFSNAIRYSPSGGVIDVAVSDACLPDGRPGLECRIMDRGAGIAEAELGKIFDRFGQSSATKKSGGGSGLGLTICRELIDLHGGHIWAANREEGGAVFTFIIPKTAVEPSNAAAGSKRDEESNSSDGAGFPPSWQEPCPNRTMPADATAV